MPGTDFVRAQSILGGGLETVDSFEHGEVWTGGGGRAEELRAVVKGGRGRKEGGGGEGGREGGREEEGGKQCRSAYLNLR
eukprot:894226-Rhodomonas_salina.4